MTKGNIASKENKNAQMLSTTKVTSSSSFVFACFLRVQNRERLQISQSETFSFGRFRFWLQAKDAYHSFQKMLRIIINCGMDDETQPPAFDMRYKFRLINHADDKLSKNKQGTWNYPRYERLYWHPISYSDIIEAAGDWFAQ